MYRNVDIKFQQTITLANKINPFNYSPDARGQNATDQL